MSQVQSEALDARVEQALALLTRLVKQGKHFPRAGVHRELASLRRALARSEGARARGVVRPLLRLVK